MYFNFGLKQSARAVLDRGNSIAKLQDNYDNVSIFEVLCAFLANLVVRFSA